MSLPNVQGGKTAVSAFYGSRVSLPALVAYSPTKPGAKGAGGGRRESIGVRIPQAHYTPLPSPHKWNMYPDPSVRTLSLMR
eukprot:scaffold1651_cov317-Pinguiococcus_pyrenoidosus.AAC.13